MHRLLCLAAAAAAAVAGLATAGPATAQFKKPEDAIAYRQGAMTLQNHHLGQLYAMAVGRVPFDARAAADQIEVIALLSRLQFSAFTEGSDLGETKAKPTIWTERARFDAAAKRNQDDVLKLVAAGQTGSADAIKAAVGAVGQSCKACHDSYRAE